MDFSRKASSTRNSPKKANNMIPSPDSDFEPHNKKKIVASGTQNISLAKQQRDHFSIISSSDESDYGKDDDDKYDKKLSTTNKRKKTNSVPSWKDCPTAVASNVKIAGEYRRITYDNKNHRVKKAKKKTDLR